MRRASYSSTTQDFFQKDLHAGDGHNPVTNHNLHRTNVPKNFSYSTGWDWVTYVGGGHGPMATLFLKFAPSGMATLSMTVIVTL